MPHRVGYCCINTELRDKYGITTGRTMRRKTFEEKGLEYVAELAIQNVHDLQTILQWNIQNNIRLFRIGSDMFPWWSEYEFHHLPNIDNIMDELAQIGKYIQQNDIRISSHPDHFVKLGSNSSLVVENSIKELNNHGVLFDMLDLPTDRGAPINIHVGMNLSEDVVNRWVTNFNKLNFSVQDRLVVENDDKENAFSVKDLYELIYPRIGVPITFDYFHHTFNTGGLTSEEAANMAASTWSCTPLFHYSESKNINENVNGNPRAHADFVFNKIDDYGLVLDIDLEAKAKEQALKVYNNL